MLQFTPLTVSDVLHETADSVSIGLRVPDEYRDAFSFQAGQFLTLRTKLDGEEVRRAYSLCLTPAHYARSGTLRVAVKAVRGGRFSNYATRDLRAGDVLDVLPPDGRFVTPLDRAHRKHYVAFAGGSGITPILSLIETVLASEPHSTFTLVYGNRMLASIMFAEALEDIKNRYVDRFVMIHIISDEPQEVALFHGQLDARKCSALLETLIAVDSVDDFFICGPEPMMDAVEAALRAAHVAERAIHV
jgi:ring-1,2-phenylacetyl-CoA epoxidase subunit PaaE